MPGIYPRSDTGCSARMLSSHDLQGIFLPRLRDGDLSVQGEGRRVAPHTGFQGSRTVPRGKSRCHRPARSNLGPSFPHRPSCRCRNIDLTLVGVRLALAACRLFSFGRGRWKKQRILSRLAGDSTTPRGDNGATRKCRSPAPPAPGAGHSPPAAPEGRGSPRPRPFPVQPIASVRGHGPWSP